MAVLVRLLVIVLLLSSTVSLSARGRTHGYQAGGGVHRARHGKARVKKAKEKPKKPSPPPSNPSPSSPN